MEQRGDERVPAHDEPDPFWEALNFAPAWATTSQRAAEMDAYVGVPAGEIALT